MTSFADFEDVCRIGRAEPKSPIGSGPKRIVDIILAISGIIILAPLLLICFVAITSTSSGPALSGTGAWASTVSNLVALSSTMAVDAPKRLRDLL